MGTCCFACVAGQCNERVIGLARAIYRQPSILIFDEATSALDNITESELMDAIEKMGGLDALMQKFRDLLAEQRKRHQGGNKWIGTGGASAFGAFGYNPEGFRMGQDKIGIIKQLKSGTKENSEI